MKLNPVNASKSVIFFLKKRSAPVLVKTLCFSIWTTKIKSPARQSGSSSPSPGIVIGCPWGIPF